MFQARNRPIPKSNAKSLYNRRGPASALEHCARRSGFLAGVAHANDAQRVPGSSGAGDVADFFAVQTKRGACFGHNVAGKGQPDTLAVDLATGAHTFDDFLAGVATFGVADVGILQTGFVRDLFFAEVVDEPWDALGKAGGAHRRVSDRPAPVSSRCFGQNLPQSWQVLGFRKEFGARDFSWRALRDTAGNRTDGAIVEVEVIKLGNVDARKLLSNRRGFRALQRQGAEARRLIDQSDVIHDDVFVEPLDQAFANHGVRHAEKPVGKRIRLDLRENMALRIEQQRNGAVADGEVFDVVGQDSVEIADAVGPGERKVSAIVLVDQRDRVSRIAVLRRLVAKVIGHGAGEPNAPALPHSV